MKELVLSKYYYLDTKYLVLWRIPESAAADDPPDAKSECSYPNGQLVRDLIASILWRISESNR